LGAGVVAPAVGSAVPGLAPSGLASAGLAAVGAVALGAGVAPFPAFVTGLVVVVRSLAAREARPGSVTLGIRIRGMSGLPSGMRES
jgi:hypothetical protein